MIPVYLAQLLANCTINLSPKVVVPGFFGLLAVSVVCELGHWGIKADFGSVMTGIVVIMITLGILTPHTTIIGGTTLPTIDLTSTRNEREPKP
jgi:hypothetical protein